MSACNAPVVMLLMKSLCLGAMMKAQCGLFRCGGNGHSTPLCPSGISPFASVDADGYTTVSNASLFLDAFVNGDFSQLAV